MNNTDRQSIATFSCGPANHDLVTLGFDYECGRCGMRGEAIRLEASDPVRFAAGGNSAAPGPMFGIQPAAEPLWDGAQYASRVFQAPVLMHPKDKAAIEAELRPRFADPFIQTAVEAVRASGNFIINGTDVMVQDRNAPGGAVLIHVTRTMLDDPRNCGLLLEESYVRIQATGADLQYDSHKTPAVTCKHCGSLVCDCDQYAVALIRQVPRTCALPWCGQSFIREHATARDPYCSLRCAEYDERRGTVIAKRDAFAKPMVERIRQYTAQKSPVDSAAVGAMQGEIEWATRMYDAEMEPIERQFFSLSVDRPAHDPVVR